MAHAAGQVQMTQRLSELTAFVTANGYEGPKSEALRSQWMWGKFADKLPHGSVKKLQVRWSSMTGWAHECK